MRLASQSQPRKGTEPHVISLVAEEHMTDHHETGIEVMLNVFSGRPNPIWIMGLGQVEELRHMLQANRDKPRESPAEQPILGYRGFTLTNRQRIVDLPYRMHVFGGATTVFDRPAEPEGKPPEARYYADDARQIERWLLADAAERGYAETIAAMGGPRS